MPGLNALLNYHPLFVHFPIALWLAALFFEALSLWRRTSNVLGIQRAERRLVRAIVQPHPRGFFLVRGHVDSFI